jgi:hypothetical protein
LALGIDNPEQWLHESSPRKIAIWEAFFRVEPWGSDWERTAIMTQVISNTIAACHGVKSKNHYKLADFMPSNWFGRKQRRQVDKQSIQDFFAFAQKYRK